MLYWKLTLPARESSLTVHSCTCTHSSLHWIFTTPNTQLTCWFLTREENRSTRAPEKKHSNASKESTNRGAGDWTKDRIGEINKIYEIYSLIYCCVKLQTNCAALHAVLPCNVAELKVISTPATMCALQIASCYIPYDVARNVYQYWRP
jgi:hypothetical protein